MNILKRMFRRNKKKNNISVKPSTLNNSSDITPDPLNQVLTTNMILSNTDSSYSDNHSSFSDSGGSCDCGGDSGGCGGGD